MISEVQLAGQSPDMTATLRAHNASVEARILALQAELNLLQRQESALRQAKGRGSRVTVVDPRAPRPRKAR
jgi:hypothetical protein